MNVQVDARTLMTLTADQTPCHDALLLTEARVV